MPSTPPPDDCPDCGLTEEWVPVKGWEDLYEISTLGRTRSLGVRRRCGYGKTRFIPGHDLTARRIMLCRPGLQMPVMRHVLVFRQFLKNQPPGSTPAFKDGNRKHLCVTNLTWELTHLSYRAAHQRVGRVHGPARFRTCIDCGGAAREWSYLKTGIHEVRQNWGGYDTAYSLDPMQYVPRCKKCHLAVDGWWLKYAEAVS